MPVAVAYTPPDLFLVHATGEVTYHECQAAIDAILAHPRYGEVRKVLVDANGVVTAPSTGELRQLAHELKPLIARGFGPMAIVTGSSFVYGVAKMFTVFAEVFGLRVRAFRSLAEGEAWLAEVEPARATRNSGAGHSL